MDVCLLVVELAAVVVGQVASRPENRLLLPSTLVVLEVQRKAFAVDCSRTLVVAVAKTVACHMPVVVVLLVVQLVVQLVVVVSTVAVPVVVVSQLAVQASLGLSPLAVLIAATLAV